MKFMAIIFAVMELLVSFFAGSFWASGDTTAFIICAVTALVMFAALIFSIGCMAFKHLDKEKNPAGNYCKITEVFPR